MNDAPADTIVILSTELIEKIAEEYFNSTMFKLRVKVVDSGSHGDKGYMFSLAFPAELDKRADIDSVLKDAEVMAKQQQLNALTQEPQRAKNGRFVSALKDE